MLATEADGCWRNNCLDLPAQYAQYKMFCSRQVSLLAVGIHYKSYGFGVLSQALNIGWGGLRVRLILGASK